MPHEAVMPTGESAASPVTAAAETPVMPDRLRQVRLRYLSCFSFRVMLAVGLATIAVLTVSTRFNDPDLWYHLKLGQVVWTTHSIPTKDLLSHTAYEHAWTAHEWLAQVIIYGVYKLAGETGLMMWLSITSSLVLMLIYVLGYLHSRNALVAFLGGVCGWLFTTVGLAIRPQVMGYTFLLLELILLELAAKRRRFLWLLPPLFAVWVNCHGSYFFGMAVLGVYWISSFQKQDWGQIAADPSPDWKLRSAIVGLCGMALCLNPVGVKLLLYPLDTLFQQTTSMNSVEEWMAPDLRSGRALAMIAAAGLTLLIPLLRRSDLLLRELLLVAMTFYLASQHVRMLFVFGIVVSPVLCRLAAPLLGMEREKTEHPIVNAVLMAACLLAMILAFPNTKAIERQVRRGNPAGAVEFVRRANLSGPMLNEYVFGGYLMWALPEHKDFVDGRADVFDWTGVLAEYGRWATRSEAPNLLLDKYKIRFCILSKNSPPLLDVAHLPGWKQAYSDDVAAVLVRQDGAPR